MKKALRIVSIVYIPLIIISILTGIVLGAWMLYGSGNPDIQAQIVDSMQSSGSTGVTTENVAFILTLYGILMIIAAVSEVAALVADVLLLLHIKNENASYSKVSWIVLGAIALAFGATGSGVLGIVYGAMLKTTPNNQNRTDVVAEVKEDDQPKPSDYDAPDHLD